MQQKTLLATRALCLSRAAAPTLKDADITVGCVIIDHYNHDSGRCDPGMTRIASLADTSTRNVLRSVRRLEQEGLIKTVRHGGLSNRNFYAPQWDRFEQLHKAWQQLFKSGGVVRPAPEMSAPSRQNVVAKQDRAVQETCRTNQSNLTGGCGEHSNEPSTPSLPRQLEGLPRKKGPARTSKQFVPKSIASKDVAANEAERRWNDDVSKQFCGDVIRHAKVIDLVADPVVQQAITDAERKYRGGGIASIERLLSESALHTTTTGASS